MFDIHDDGFLVDGGLTAPVKIQAFILNQIIISVTYTRYCMAVGGPSVHNVVLRKHTKSNSEKCYYNG